MQAILYKEDFENERKDREKAHNLKEDMRLDCDQKVHEMTILLETERLASHQTIQSLNRQLEKVDHEKRHLEQEKEVRATRSSTKKQDIQQKDKEIEQLEDDLFEANQKAKIAQEEVQAISVQVKQYQKREDQRLEKVLHVNTLPTIFPSANKVFNFRNLIK